MQSNTKQQKRVLKAIYIFDGFFYTKINDLRRIILRKRVTIL